MLDELYYDNGWQDWAVCLHGSNGYSREVRARFARGVQEPADRKATYECDARRRGDEAIVKAVGQVIAHEEE